MKTSIGFICIGNSCRSQMAEGFAREYGSDILDVYSAGTHPAQNVNENAIMAMKEKGIDISSQQTKGLEDIPQQLNIVITMGCGVECPLLLADHREDWELEDPIGMPLERFRQIRDTIEKRVKQMIKKLETTKKK